jgi:hypothetical protein
MSEPRKSGTAARPAPDVRSWHKPLSREPSFPLHETLNLGVHQTGNARASTAPVVDVNSLHAKISEQTPRQAFF